MDTKCKKCKYEDVSEIGDYGSNDFVIISGNSFVMGEIKIRTFEYDKYPTAVIELDKINRLMEKFELYHQMGSNNKLLYYAVYPNSRKVLVFDIMGETKGITYEWCPIATADPSKGNKLKPMVNFDINKPYLTIEY
jgi:hypothetical protein